MTFTTPLALLLLLLLPIIIYLGWPRLAFRRRRDIASLILRTLIVLLLILALAGTLAVQAADKLAVVFLVDVSDSLGPQTQADQLTYIRDALNTMGPDDEAAIVVFGGNALVERPMNNVREVTPFRSTPNTGNTDLEEAIGLGLALFPADAARRIVILSDGRQTVGDANAAARRAAATGVEISYVTFARQPGPEVLLADVQVPGAVGAGQSFDLSLTVEADEATPATITVLASGQIVHQESVDLRAGTNRYALPLQAGNTGFRDFQVRVDPEGADSFYQNNELSAFSRVVGPPRVLLVATDPSEASFIAEALSELDLIIDQIEPSDLPLGLAALEPYQSVILTNVSATELSTRRMELLQTYVRDLGGGLIVSGGPDTFGPGGYFQTPLEETLPIEMQLRDQQRIPQLTIAYVIDQSGSMGAAAADGSVAIELAKEAIIRSIDFLQPTDRAGVASFDTAGTWLAQVQPVRNRLLLQDLVARLAAGGGTDILAGMNLAAQTLRTDPSPRKHIILLTDGGANPAGLVELSEELFNDHDVTTSVIAIGAGAADFLGDMATAGGGQYHAVDTAARIPTIFTTETVLATRSYIIEEEFVPTLSGLSPIMNGINAAPPLLGYVAATAKQTAQVILRGPEPFSDPLLVQWQYGLGRAVAFTSDATGRWAANWVAWDDFARFWSQAVRWTITEGADANLEARVIMEGEQARLVVDARDNAGAFLNGLELQSSLVDPDLNSELVPLQQVAPGRYETTFTPDAEGAYFLRIVGAGGDGENPLSVSQTAGWVMSYSPEYSLRGQGADTDLLAEIAELTNGQALNVDAPEAVFEHNLVAQAALAPLWPQLLILALLLLPVDIAVRRLLVTRSDLRRLRAAVFQRGGAVVDTSSERISSLMGAKARAQQTTETPAASPTGTAAALRRRREELRSEPAAEPPRPTGSSAPPEPSYRPRSGASPSTTRTTSGSGGNLAGRLLEKRRPDDDDSSE
ncbi:MAG: VWA domain-containing protein [Chloroflexi bacterium]|nr:VWA domain-containing protein [Chloroflexota bacterium]